MLAVTAVIVVGSWLPPTWRGSLAGITAVVGLPLALIGLGTTFAFEGSRRRRAPGDPEALLRRACGTLADQVRRQWAREAEMRGLLRPDPLPVRWSPTGRPVGPEPTVPDPAADDPELARWSHGDVTGVVEAWQALPARQLVIVGAAGSGKTSLAVLLVHGLLTRWRPGEPVPVLVGLAGWDPRLEHADTWLARRLVEEYPMLADQDRYGPQASVDMVDQGRVVPVLDGLDEMPEPLRPLAVEALTAAVGPDRPMVVTCRAQEYQDAISTTGMPLARAAVVELEPITGQQAATYLPAGQINGPRRWAAVVEHLRTHPQGALALALSTPWMVYLARTGYTSPETDPAELTRFADPDRVEAHLMESYLSVVYGPQLPARRSDRQPPPRSYSPQRARRWLTFLANHLQRQDSHDLAYWRLAQAVPHGDRMIGVVGGLVCGLGTALVMGLLTAMLFDPRRGWLTALIAAPVGGALGGLGVGTRLEEPLRPHHLALRPRQLVTAAAFGLLIGALGTWASNPVSGAVVGTMAALGAGLLGGIARPTTLQEAVDPRLVLRADRTVLVTVRFAFGLLGGLFLGLITSFMMSAREGVLFGVAFGTALILTAGVVGGGYGNTWAKFEIARCLLGMRGHLPLALTSFLEDAYRRGVLRQAGAVYQFRHAHLQNHLAGWSTDLAVARDAARPGPPTPSAPPEPETTAPEPVARPAETGRRGVGARAVLAGVAFAIVPWVTCGLGTWLAFLMAAMVVSAISVRARVFMSISAMCYFGVAVGVMVCPDSGWWFDVLAIVAVVGGGVHAAGQAFWLAKRIR